MGRNRLEGSAHFASYPSVVHVFTYPVSIDILKIDYINSINFNKLRRNEFHPET